MSDDLCLMLCEMEHVVFNLRRRHHTSRIVIGCDLSLSLAPNLEGLTGSRIHPNPNSAPARWREAVTEWMHSLRLRAACTFDYENTDWSGVWDHEENLTHENSNKDGKYQLDYILVSNYVRGKVSVVRGYDLGTLLTQIFVWSIRRYGAHPNAWIILRKDGMHEVRNQD